MALTLITTAGSATANAYASLAAVTTILESIPGTGAWADVATGKQEQAIVFATWVLDNHVVWKGAVTSPCQALMFPRHGLYSRLGEIYQWGTAELDWTIIPPFLERATAVGAFSFATTTRIAEQDGENISSLSIPGLSMTLGSSSARSLIPPSVFEIIRDYAYQVQGHTARRVVRS